MRAEMRKEESEISGDVSGTRKEFGSERADAFSRITSEIAQEESTQSSTGAEAGGLLRLFSNLLREVPCLWPGRT